MLACIIRYCGIMVGNICVVSAVFQTMELYMKYKNRNNLYSKNKKIVDMNLEGRPFSDFPNG